MAVLHNLSSSRLLSSEKHPYDAEIEYLRSTGTQWIDTGINGGNLVTVEIKAIFAYADDSKLFGYRINYASARNIILASGDGKYYLDYGNGSQFNSGVGVDSNIHTFKLDKNNAYIDEKLTNVYPAQTFTGGSMYLFACNQNGNVNGATRATVYYTKISKNGILVRDFIPVRVGTTGYMYDKVSGELFGNSGTGNFVLGPDV